MANWKDELALVAQRNRREIVKAKLSRREMVRLRPADSERIAYRETRSQRRHNELQRRHAQHRRTVAGQRRQDPGEPPGGAVGSADADHTDRRFRSDRPTWRAVNLMEPP